MPDYTYQQITLKAGECFNLPAGASLIYASNTEDLTSECDIPTTFPVTCYGMGWENQNNAPQDDAVFVGVTIDGVYYPFTNNIDFSNSNSANNLETQLGLDVPDGIFIEGATCDIGGTGQYIYFQSVGSTIVFKVANPSGTDAGTLYFYLIPDELDDCGCPPDL